MQERHCLDFSRPDITLKENPDGLPSPKSKGPSDTIVIDAGSWQYRAGYASQNLPSLVFDPIIHRYQGKTGEASQFNIGRVPPMGVTRLNSTKALYEDSNIIMNSGNLEHTLDHIFSKLNVTTTARNEGVSHPIFMTEVVANPPCCRRECSELLFEAYQVPKACFALDAPLSLYYNMNNDNTSKSLRRDALIISIGHFCTIITAIVDGLVRPEGVRRINFGGKAMSELLLSLLQCKYPAFPVKMTLPQAQAVVHQCCRVSQDYTKDLCDPLQQKDDHGYVIQFPYSTETVEDRVAKEIARDQLAGKRRDQAQTLRERAEKQRAEKLEAKKQQVESMKRLLQSVINDQKSLDDEAEEEDMKQLRLFGYQSLEELQAAMETEQKALNKLLGIEEPKEVADYSLVDVPDSDLNPEQIREKRKQRLLKASADARERQRKEKEEREAKMQAQRDALERKRIEDFEKWRSDLYEERNTLTTTIKSIYKKREALADRRSHASGARLKNVVSLVEDDDEEDRKPTKKRKNTTKEKNPPPLVTEVGFGDDDADWLIYRKIVGEDDDETLEGMQSRLDEIEVQLNEHDGESFMDLLTEEMNSATTVLDRLWYGHHTNTQQDQQDPKAIANQLYINIERIRVPEPLFQPSIVGLDQAGLTEAIMDLLKIYTPESRERLVNNVFLTGGASQLPGFEDRFYNELRMSSPTSSSISIQLAKNASLDAWRGGSLLCRLPENDKLIPWITKEWYEEHGGDRLPKVTWFTNQF